jgi:hypothetical protein
VRAAALWASGDSVVRAIAPPCLPAGTTSVQLLRGTLRSTIGTGSYVATAPTLRLAAYEGAVLGAGTLAQGCAYLPADGGRYLVVPNFGAVPARDGDRPQEGYSVSIAPAVVPLQDWPGAGSAMTAAATPSPQQRLDALLREREREWARTLERPALPAPGEMLAIAPPPLGSQRTFKVLRNLEATEFTDVRASLSFAGDRVLVYTDASAPSGVGFSAASLQSIGRQFDAVLYPEGVRLFGAETDLDRNGRVIVLLTQAVNRLTPSARCDEGFVTGFFYGLDLFPNARNSNGGEIFYAFVPDPANATQSCAQPVSRVESIVPATFIHELQHMISFGQHVIARNGDNELLWLNEGLSHLAEEAAGRLYEARYPPPSGRTNPSQLFPDSAQGFLVPNFSNAYRWLRAPSTASATSFDSTAAGTLAERGAAWLFLRWLVAQKGDAIVPRLVQTTRVGRANIEAAAGEPFAQLFGDFALATWADSIPGAPRTAVPTRYRFGNRNLRQIFARLNALDVGTFPVVFPASTTTLSVATPLRTGTLTYGTTGYHLVNAPAAGDAVPLRFGSGAGFAAFNAAYGAQVSIIRLP